ncbi:MAG: phage BR0599 family protein [Phycisphaerales bacterium]
MTYNTYEISSFGGRPIALYEFQYGNTYWRYCTADEDQTVGLDENGDPAVWTALAISDDGVKQGGSDQNDLQIQTQINNPVAGLFRNTQPSGKVWLTVRRWHIGDPDDETPLLWKGTVINATEDDPATVRLVCRSLGGTYDRNGLRLAWSRMCPHVLYGIGCNRNGSNDKEDHAYAREIATLDGVSFTCVTHAEPTEGTFTGGFVEWSRTDGSLVRRGIESQSGNYFLLLGTTDGLEIGTAVTIYPGCSRSTTNCKAFGNLANFGGFPHLPGKSPFDGTPIF